jgi:signal transduction histidine kinase
MGLAGQLEDVRAAEPCRATAWRDSGDPKFVFSVDDLTIRDVNPAAEALLRTPLDQLRGQSMSRVLDAPYMVRLREALEQGQPVDRIGGHILLAAGPEPAKAFSISVAPVAVAGLRLCRLTPVSSGDADRDLRRLNWALAAFARSSTALIRSSSFKDTVTGVCEAIVGEDDYLVAAVGLVEHGPGLPVRLVAEAGRAVSYVRGLNLSWSADVPEGLGPTGRAIRSGRPFIMRDSLDEPVFSFWQDKAAGFGIRSSVTVPFGEGDTPIGALLVYGGQPNDFGERELDVFARLGRELAFALKVEDERAQLRLAEEARRAAEESAHESLAELARAARVISVATFASSIAHEVNQPVTAIMANSEAALRWLAKDPPNLEEARAAIERITRDASRTSAVVGRTRGMLAKDLGRRGRVDLRPLIEETLLFIEVPRKRGSVKVETEFAPDLPPVWADPVQIQQVVVNLVTNGIDAMKGVSGRKRVLKILTSSLGPGEVMVSVADTGSGVDGGNLEHIFTHLFTTKLGGMGLGLPICKAIVEAHGGRLEMARNEPFGAVFRFVLPATEAG